MVTPAVDVGYAHVDRFRSGSTMHAVVRTDEGWATKCTGALAYREYRGFVGTIKCDKCRRAVKAELGVA